MTELDLAPACNDARTGNAAPGIRLHKFTKSFENNTVQGFRDDGLDFTAINMAGVLTGGRRRLSGPSRGRKRQQERSSRKHEATNITRQRRFSDHVHLL